MFPNLWVNNTRLFSYYRLLLSSVFQNIFPICAFFDLMLRMTTSPLNLPKTKMLGNNLPAVVAVFNICMCSMIISLTAERGRRCQKLRLRFGISKLGIFDLIYGYTRIYRAFPLIKRLGITINPLYKLYNTCPYCTLRKGCESRTQKDENVRRWCSP